MTTLAPTLQRIRSTFADTVSRHNGAVTDEFEDGDLLIMRAILPGTDHVRDGDVVNQGVALKCSGLNLEVHPYVFRQVCSNGAIMAQSVSSIRLQRFEEWQTSDASDVLIDLVETIRACATGPVFDESVNQMQRAARTPRTIDMLLNLLPMLSQMPNQHALLRTVIDNFLSEDDHTTFGAMNAVTATARETSDARLKWDLESLGGSVPARLEWLPQQEDWIARRRPVHG